MRELIIVILTTAFVDVVAVVLHYFCYFIHCISFAASRLDYPE